MPDRPRRTPTHGVHVIPGEIPDGVVPPSTSMTPPTLRDQLRDALLAEGLAGPDTVDAIVSVALHVVEPTALEREVDAFHAEGGLRDDLVYDLARIVYPPADGLRDRLAEVLAPLWPVTMSRNVEHHRNQILAAADALMPVVQAWAAEQTNTIRWHIGKGRL